MKNNFSTVFGYAVLFWLIIFALSFPISSQGQERGRGSWRSGDQRDSSDRRDNSENRNWNRRGEDRRSDDRDREEQRGTDRRWDPVDFIERLDTNGNGRIDPSEVSGRSERYLQGLGFDTSKSIPIGQIIGRIEGGGDQKGQSSQERNRRVPGFGAINEPVQNFGAVSDEQLEKMFSPEVIRRVNETLDRYDRNGDGMLDEQEIQRVNWGSPPYQQSDLDGDGKLSRLELAYRYRVREAFREDYSERKRSEEKRTDSFDREDRGMFRAGTDASFRSSRTGRSSSSRGRESAERARNSSSQTRRNSNSNDNRRNQTEAWVDSVMERYDKDGDGKLNAEEIKDMRNPPKLPASGFITRDQYVDYLMNDGKLTEDSSGSDKTSTRQGSTTSSAGTRSGSSRFSRNRELNDAGNQSRGSRGDRDRSKTTFEDFDTNGNGKIEMHEFSDQWDEEKLTEFYQIDTNRDGVITRREWAAAGRP